MMAMTTWNYNKYSGHLTVYSKITPGRILFNHLRIESFDLAQQIAECLHHAEAMGYDQGRCGDEGFANECSIPTTEPKSIIATEGSDVLVFIGNLVPGQTYRLIGDTGQDGGRLATFDDSDKEILYRCQGTGKEQHFVLCRERNVDRADEIFTVAEFKR